MVCQWDRDLLNVVANVAFAEFVGMTPAEIRGRSFAEVFDKNLRRLNPADLDAVLAGEQRLAECELTDRHGMARRFQTAYVPDIVSGAVTGFYLQATELTSHVAHEQACEDEARMFRTCVENAPIGQAIADTSLQGCTSTRFLLDVRVHRRGGAQHQLPRVRQPEDIEVAEADLAALKNDPNSHVATELRVVRRDGTAIWVQRNAVMVPAGHDSRDILIGQFQDITARKQAEAELARLAVTDPLTGLLNRQALVDSIGRQRDVDPSASVGIVFLDLDGFKKINDERGHAVGDAVLVQVAECLPQVVGAPDSVYRLGGDEFVILARVADSESHVTELADLLRRALSGNYDGGGVPVSLTASVGSTWGPIADLEELLHLADARMYRHKARQREGRDSGRVTFSPGARADRVGRAGEPAGVQARGEAVVNVLGPHAAAVDEAGVALQQRRPGRNPLPGVVGRLDTAHADQHQSATHPFVQSAQHLEDRRATADRRRHRAPGRRRAVCAGRPVTPWCWSPRSRLAGSRPRGRRRRRHPRRTDRGDLDQDRCRRLARTADKIGPQRLDGLQVT